jgi:hypothetical protein
VILINGLWSRQPQLRSALLGHAKDHLVLVADQTGCDRACLNDDLAGASIAVNVITVSELSGHRMGGEFASD